MRVPGEKQGPEGVINPQCCYDSIIRDASTEIKVQTISYAKVSITDFI